jgi:hypothetical protein
MEEGLNTSHFWVASSGCFSSMLMIVAEECVSGSLDAVTPRAVASLEVFDVDGHPVQKLEVEYPRTEVGIIELEPFLTSLKMRGGLAHGHLVVRTERGLRHFCRQRMGEQSELIPSPRLRHGREMSFLPLLLGAQREHLLLLLNGSDADAQINLRLMYGTRSPEWTVDVPPNGSKVVALEHELLASFDDSSWRKGVAQGYLRISPRGNGVVGASLIERISDDEQQKEWYRWIGG